MSCVTPLWWAKPIWKTFPLLLVTIVNFLSLFLFLLLLLLLLYSFYYFSNIPNHHLSWGVLFIVEFKVLPGGVYYAWFLVCIFEIILFSLKSNNLLWSWFINRGNLLTHTIIPGHQKHFTCFRHILWWIWLLLNNCLMILSWPQSPYNWDYYCFVLSTLDIYYCYPYKLSWWFYVISLKYPGLECMISCVYIWNHIIFSKEQQSIVVLIY